MIDDDAGTLLGYKSVLRAAGHQVTTAALGEDGIAAAQRDQFDVVLCDQRLPDIPGIDAIREISKNCPQTRVVLVTAWATPELMVEATRAGAAVCADKPLIGEGLIRVVDEALRQPPGVVRTAEADGIGYGARRWADLVVGGIGLADDPKTIQTWSRGVAIARGTLKKRCQAVRVTPKESLDLVRLLRIVTRHPDEPWDLQRRLDILDDRTAEALLRRAGFSRDRLRVPPIESFLSRQRLIVAMELIEAIRERLVRHRSQ